MPTRPENAQRLAPPLGRVLMPALGSVDGTDSLVPVQAVGFEDLAKRVAAQDERGAAYAAKLRELDASVNTVKQHLELRTATQLAELKQRHRHNVQRMLNVRPPPRLDVPGPQRQGLTPCRGLRAFSQHSQIVKQVETIRQRHAPVSAAEEAMQAKLDALQRELDRPNQVRARTKTGRRVAH